jgi:transposase-like protein
MRRAGAAGRAATPATGTIAKTVQTGVGPVPLQVPRDGAGSFEPLLVPKRAGRVSGGLDDMIASLYAHGMSNRDIIHHLRQVYGTELSASTVSAVTDAVLEEVNALAVPSAGPAGPAGGGLIVGGKVGIIRSV